MKFPVIGNNRLLDGYINSALSHYSFVDLFPVTALGYVFYSLYTSKHAKSANFLQLIFHE